MGDVVSISENDPIFESDFMRELAKQMKAIDTYDSYNGWSTAKILDPYVLTKERRAAIPVVGDPDEITIARIKAFYNVIATLIEKECGLMAVPMLNLSHEGFGRVIISVGKLVVMDRTLRDVHRFGFASLSKMKDEADKYLSVALEIIGKHSDVAGM